VVALCAATRASREMSLPPSLYTLNSRRSLSDPLILIAVMSPDGVSNCSQLSRLMDAFISRRDLVLSGEWEWVEG
jgi:hypothetical protein